MGRVDVRPDSVVSSTRTPPRGALGRGWIAEEALAIAVYCSLTTGDLREALLLAVNHSGESVSLAGEPASTSITSSSGRWRQVLRFVRARSIIMGPTRRVPQEPT